MSSVICRMVATSLGKDVSKYLVYNMMFILLAVPAVFYEGLTRLAGPRDTQGLSLHYHSLGYAAGQLPWQPVFTL